MSCRWQKIRIAFVVISLFLHVYGIEHIHGNILNWEISAAILRIIFVRELT